MTARTPGNRRGFAGVKVQSAQCPCGTDATYPDCCQPLHQGAQVAISAEQLMRSRYCAYARMDEPYLLATWHASARPATLDLASQRPALTWLGLNVLAVQTVDVDHASVQFIARYRAGGGRAQRLHETSRFVREDGRWYYLDGVIED